MITRRNFIQTLGFAAIAGASLNIGGTAFGQTLKSDDLFSLPPESLSNPVLSFTSAHFTPFIGTDFQIRQEGKRRTETLKLIKVDEIQRKDNLAKGIQGESFSLMFSNTRETQLAGQSFEFSHPALGAFTLFLSPVNKEPNQFEAIINHLRA
jgi:hypothetical protein